MEGRACHGMHSNFPKYCLQHGGHARLICKNWSAKTWMVAWPWALIVTHLISCTKSQNNANVHIYIPERMCYTYVVDPFQSLEYFDFEDMIWTDRVGTCLNGLLTILSMDIVDTQLTSSNHYFVGRSRINLDWQYYSGSRQHECWLYHFDTPWWQPKLT